MKRRGLSPERLSRVIDYCAWHPIRLKNGNAYLWWR